jgi:phage shock protein C
MQVNPRRLYRSRDRQLAGVAGGMAEYLNIDPTVVRVLWILAAILTGGLVLLAYIVLAIITPENPYLAAGPAPVGYPGYGPGAGAAGYGPTGYTQAANPTTASAAGWSAPPASPTWSPDWAAAAAADAQARQQARGRGFGAAAIVGTVLIVIGGIALADAALPAWSSAAVLGPAVIIALGAAIVVASVRRTATPAAETAAPASPAAPVAPASPAPAGAQSAGQTSTLESTDTQPVDPASFG